MVMVEVSKLYMADFSIVQMLPCSSLARRKPVSGVNLLRARKYILCHSNKRVMVEHQKERVMCLVARSDLAPNHNVWAADNFHSQLLSMPAFLPSAGFYSTDGIRTAMIDRFADQE